MTSRTLSNTPSVDSSEIPLNSEPGGSARGDIVVPHCCGDICCGVNTFVTRVRLKNGRVDEAWSTGRLKRNVDALLKGGVDRHGRPQFEQQAHCLCNDGHALAAIRALEDLAGATPPNGALLVRNMVQALRCIKEHLLHVYVFHLSDWVNLDAALRAAPARTASLAPRPGDTPEYFHRTLSQLQKLHQTGSTNGSGSGEHPDYHGPDELHLRLYAHCQESLHIVVLIDSALSLLGCGTEGFKAYQWGGLPEDMDLGAGVRNQLRELLTECRDFLHSAFLPDLENLVQTYSHWATFGRGCSFLSCGDYIHPWKNSPIFPGGIIAPTNGAGSHAGRWKLHPIHAHEIAEDREPQWSSHDRGRYRPCPGNAPNGMGAAPQDGQEDNLWISAPRHGGDACEVGSLARILGGWTMGNDRVRQAMVKTLDACGLHPGALNSTLGRVLSRGIESSILSQAALEWIEDLDASMNSGSAELRMDLSLRTSGQGTGRVEVPRGTLTHTIRIENGRIADHDYLIPSLWNFSPRDSHGRRGPLERALLDTPVADPNQPLEILRTVHELDPCNACLIVIEDTDTGRISQTNA